MGQGLLLRIAIRNACNAGAVNWSRRDRLRMLKAIDEQPELFELISIEVAATDSFRALGDDPVPPEPSPTPILDKLGQLIGQWVKWVIENQDEILRMVFTLIDKIMEIVMMFMGPKREAKIVTQWTPLGAVSVVQPVKGE